MPDPSRYVIGDAHPNRQDYATFETKPTTQHTDTSVDTGGGYERWRSKEWRPHTSRKASEDVYVPVHRLMAVSECYPEDMDVGDILEHLSGRDVHHSTGVEWCNIGDSPNFEDAGLEVIDHGRHSAITQAEMRAWAEDAKRATQQSRITEEPDVCTACGESGTLASIPGESGQYCLECAPEVADGRPIEV